MANDYESHVNEEVHAMRAEDKSGVFDPDLPHSFEEQMTTELEDGTVVWL